jgi:hypothetical protein
MKTGDIDIDFASRDNALKYLKYTSASMTKNGVLSKHNTGIYVTEIPSNPYNLATLDYITAEQRGYFKIDFLNVHVYEKVTSEEHLVRLMNTEPPWEKLLQREFCEQVVHIGNHYSTIVNLSEPVNSIIRLAMLLALIRPGKKHLIGKTWSEIEKTIWDKTEDGYAFHKAHAIGYSHLVAIHMNILNGVG